MRQDIENQLRTSLEKDNMTLALGLMDKVKSIHTELRKDGQTPYYLHLFDVAYRVYSMMSHTGASFYYVTHRMVCLALLHDTPEDYPEYRDERKLMALIMECSPVSLVGTPMVPQDFIPGVYLLSKFNTDGSKKTKEEYYKGLSLFWTCALVKGCDGLSNLMDTISSGDPKIMQYYVRYTQKLHIPLLESIIENPKNYKPVRVAAQRLIDDLKNGIEIVSYVAQTYVLKE